MLTRFAASCFLLTAFGFSASAQDAPAAPAQVISSTIAGTLLVNRVNPKYPPLARQARIQGTVVLKETINKSGDVQNLQLVSGHPMLAPAAIEAVRQWKYQPFVIDGEAVEVSTTVQVNFTLSDKPAPPPDDNMPPGAGPGEIPGGVPGDSKSGIIIGVISILPATAGDADHPPLQRRVFLSPGVAFGLLQSKPTPPEYPPDAKAQGIQGAVVLRVEIDKDGNIYDVSALSGGALLHPAAMDAVRLWTYKPYLLNGEPIAMETTVQMNFRLGGEQGSAGNVAATTVTIDAGSAVPGGPRVATPQRIRVSSGVVQGLLLSKVNPIYPTEARQQNIQGLVVLHVIIDKEGNVDKIGLISGDPLLAPAAIDAVKQWQYRPYLLNGSPIMVDTQVQVNFTLTPH